MYIIGIDPGLTGYIAIVKKDDAFDKSFNNFKLIKMPVRRYGDENIVDVRTVDALLTQHSPAAIFIEAPLMLHQANNASRFTNQGRLLGCIERSEAASAIVRPQTWQSVVSELCKGVIAWRKGQDAKEVAFLAAQCLYGHERTLFGLKRPKDGLIDAVLIARYGAEVLERSP